MHKGLEKKGEIDPLALLAAEGLDLDEKKGKLDKLALMETLNALEKAALVWERKAAEEHKQKDIDRHTEQAQRARSVIEAVKERLPGLGQTQLEQEKMSANRDVGSAVLEAYSRILESLSLIHI